ncbi:LMO2 isoform 5 [Pongo abelii]|uniref:LMO2 isoform 5 n=1 Tax=Pongo abelii TaxID=9601 RepID=A0A2J8WG04_PONAB|nr:LMO2 isoform 5 [Pongo abelii]
MSSAIERKSLDPSESLKGSQVRCPVWPKTILDPRCWSHSGEAVPDAWPSLQGTSG